MPINRYNYESYFLLYIDKELSDQEQAEVEDFVAQHPDLAEELSLLKKTVLPAASATGFDFANLIKPETGDLDISPENHEAYFARYVDEELNPLEKEAVEKFVLKHPDAQESFEWMQKAKLKPELEIVFEPKSLLYRKEEEERKPVWIFALRWAAAAAIILLAGIWWLQRPVLQNDIDALTQQPVELPSNTEQTVDPSTLVAQDKPAERVQENNLTQTVLPQEKKQNQKASFAVTSTREERTISKIADLKSSPLQEKPELQTALVAKNLDPKRPDAPIKAPIVQNQIIDQPMQLKGMEEEKTTYVALTTNDSEEEPLYVGNTEVNKKNGLRGVIRKASRLIEKNTSLGNGEGTRKGILIGNVTLPLR
jgi:anti-sigma factor RsiW